MRIPLLAAALALLVHAVPARADKIGYVDFQRALNEVEEGKAAKAALKKEFEQKQKTLSAKEQDFNRLRQEFEKKAGVLADAESKERQAELERKFQELQVTFGQLQRELSEREGTVTRAIFEKMGAIVRELADAEGFTMVIERNDGGVIYAPASLDLTNELIRKYNARHKGGAPAAAAEKKPDAKSAKAPEPAKGAEKKAAQ